MTRYIDSSISPGGIAVPATGRFLAAQSSDLYVFGTDQIARIYSASGSIFAAAAGDVGHITVDSADIVIELYGDAVATEFIGDMVVAVAQGGLVIQDSGMGVALRSDFRGGPIFEIDIARALTGNNHSALAPTPQAFFLILNAALSNADAVARSVNLALVCDVELVGKPVV